MEKFPPSINPELYSVLGAVVAVIAEDDFNSYELNSIGNWIILVGQFMLTTAAQQQLINYRYSKSTGSRIKSDAHNHQMRNPEKANKRDVDILYDMLIKVIKEVEIIKKELD